MDASPRCAFENPHDCMAHWTYWMFLPYRIRGDIVCEPVSRVLIMSRGESRVFWPFGMLRGASPVSAFWTPTRLRLGLLCPTLTTLLHQNQVTHLT